ncbi:MAG: alpha/beta fold hydrolase [Candidatus Thorarchaeota archaeon]
MKDLYANINDIKICYAIHGRGSPIIFIHGYGGHKEGFICQIPTLSQNFKVITFDLRCSGKSDHPDKLIEMETFVEDIKELMLFLEIDKVSILGESLGGLIAQSFALTYPEKIDKLILIVTGYSTDWLSDIILENQVKSLEKKKQNLEEYFWEQAHFLYHQKMRSQMKANPKKKFYGLWSVEDLIKSNAENPITANDLRNQAHAFKNFNTFEKLGNIKNPTLLIAASHDRVIPNSQMIKMNEKIPNSSLKVIQKAGHGVYLSRAPEINQIILEFLANS